MPDSFLSRVGGAAMSGLRKAGQAVNDASAWLTPPGSDPLAQIGYAEQAGDRDLAEGRARAYNAGPAPSIFEEATGATPPAWLNAATSLLDPMGGGPAKAAALPGITRKAEQAFSLQGAMDDILRGGGQALDEVAEVGARANPTALNASGESAASLEELGRRAWAKQSGRKAVVMDRGGQSRDLIGTPGDLTPNPGERHGWLDASGRFEEVARGR